MQALCRDINPGHALSIDEIESTDLYFESKYHIPLSQLPELDTYLNHYFVPASKFKQDILRTLYYDSPDLRCFWSSVDGNYTKFKVRLRQYTQCTEGNYIIESKLRVGSRVSKHRVRFTSNDYPHHSNLGDLVSSLGEAAAPLIQGGVDCPFELLEPKLLLQYHRRRFISSQAGIRASLDTNIMGLANYPSREGYWARMVPLPFAVLELKGESKPVLPAEFRRFTRRQESISKYVGLMRIYEGIY